MDKAFMIEQLAQRIRASAEVALREHEAAAIEAREGASPDEKRADGRVALEFSQLANAQARRAQAALDEIAVLASFAPGQSGAHVGVGSILEIEDGDQGRTLFLAPVGAGIELTMPDGDGYITVVTPASPLGKAVLGCRLGDTVEVPANRDAAREWTVTFIA